MVGRSVLNCDELICFPLVLFTQPISKTLAITNENAASVAFKILTTAPNARISLLGSNQGLLRQR
jgi:hypothetical protein